MQLGTEGFVVGFLYTIVGVLLGFVTHFAPMMRSKVPQRVVMLFVITVSVVAVRKVIALDNGKTGYWIHAFWPTGWT
jgi:oligosaccharyltransferase complex subunit gamma